MKNIRIVSLFVAGILLAVLAFTATEQEQVAAGPLSPKTILQRYGFIDEDGDGINDLARDSDNDGVPNCVDEDWVRPGNGQGFQSMNGHRHQNVNQQGGGPFNYSYNHLWNNNWANNNPNFCNQTNPNANSNRNRRSNRKH